MKLRKIFLFIVVVIFYNIAYAQKTPYQKIDSLIQLSDSLRDISPNKSLDQISKAYKYSLLLNDTSLVLKSGNNLAKAQNENGLHQNSLKTILKIRDYTTNQNDSLIQMAEIDYTEGFSLLEMRQYEKSKKAFKSALNTFVLLNDSSGMSSAFISLGNIESNDQNYDKAITYYQKALQYTPVNDEVNKAYISTNMGIIYAEQNDYLKAKNNFEQTIEIYVSLNLFNELSIAYYDLGFLEYSFKHYQLAISNYLNSLKIAKDNDNSVNMMWAYEGLADVYKDMNDYKSSLLYFEKYSEIKDSLNEIQKENEIKDIEKLLAKENQDLLIQNQVKEIEEAKVKEELLNERIDKSKLKSKVLGIGFIILCILGGIGLFIYKKVKKQNVLLTNQKEIINKSLHEKEILLKEIHHRVKNNLQIISSLLNLQSNRIENDEISVLLNESKNRIQAIALVHDKLYRSNDFTSINFKEYLLEILNYQKNIYIKPDQELKIESNCEDVHLNLDVAVPLGLIASELITNAFKHGFKNISQPLINLELKRINQNQVVLIVSDNGGGLPTDFDINTSTTLGMELITALTEQINGSVDFKNENGTHFSVTFKVNQ